MWGFNTIYGVICITLSRHKRDIRRLYVARDDADGDGRVYPVLEMTQEHTRMCGYNTHPYRHPGESNPPGPQPRVAKTRNAHSRLSRLSFLTLKSQNVLQISPHQAYV